MNEIKLSTRVDEKSARLAMKLNTEALGVDWKCGDIIRVISQRADGTMILKKVGKKANKTIAHTLTKTGSGEFSHDVGLYVAYKPKRFRNKLKPANSVNAAARFIDSKKTMLQVYLPRDIFESEKCFNG